MSRLTRDGTATPASRNQILRRERGQENFPLFSWPWTDWQLYPVDLYSAVCDDYTCNTYILWRVPSTPACYWGTLRLLRARFVDLFFLSAMVRWVCTSCDSVIWGTLTSECGWKNQNFLEFVNKCTMWQSSRDLFLFACLKGCFCMSWSFRNKKTRTVTSKKHASRRANLLPSRLQP